MLMMGMTNDDNIIFMSAMTDQARLEESIAVATRDVTILSDKELEYAKQSLSKTKEIKSLRERVEYLEKMQSVNLERFKHRTKELKGSIHKELEEATLDAAGLRRLMQIKNKELRHMKTLAATILEQRSDIEVYFLEALREVREAIQQERKRTVAEKRIEIAKMRSAAASKSMGSGAGGGGGGGKGGSVFPSIKVSPANMQHVEARGDSQLALLQTEKVMHMSAESGSSCSSSCLSTCSF